MEQLPLGVRLRAASSFASFQPGGNAAVIAALEARARDPRLPPLWLWGPPGSGRSHLLQASCARAGEHARRAGYLPLAAEWPTAAVIGGFEALDLVCLDDLDRVSGDPAWQRALFAFYNEIAERGGNLVVSAACPPQALDIELPDLRSRLSASVVWKLRPLAEADQAAALHARARALGIELSEDTLQFLQRRLPRDLGALCEALDRLDGAALAQQRRLTVPFVRAVLQLPAD
jgi:DnaA-homolog protein